MVWRRLWPLPTTCSNHDDNEDEYIGCFVSSSDITASPRAQHSLVVA